MGRPLGAGEINRMNIAEMIVNSYRDMYSPETKSWVEWRNEHPEETKLLDKAQKVARDLGLIEA